MIHLALSSSSLVLAAVDVCVRGIPNMESRMPMTPCVQPLMLANRLQPSLTINLREILTEN